MQSNSKKYITTDDEMNMKQTIVEHLTELRKRLIFSIITLLAFTLLAYNFSQVIVKDMIKKAPNIEFIFIAPAELFMSYIKIALIAGLILALPVVLYNIWMFSKPGLNKDERKVILRSLFLGGILFVLGSLFGYLIVLPMTINFFGNYQMDEIKAMISFSNYLSFSITFVLSFGLVFEVPILMIIVVKLGIISTDNLKKNRKIFILLIFILAAILTPPDVVSQIMLAIPMLLLFEIGIIAAKMVEKKKVD